MRATRTIFLAFIALVLVTPAVSLAQSLEALTSAEPFTLSMTPQYPAPGSNVTITALSGNLDLANATMNVSVGGTSIYRGAVKKVEVPVGKVGALTTIKVMITSNGASYSQNISVRPEDVVLILEPLATAPPLYPGKPGEPLGGSVRVIALASFKDSAGRPLDPAALSYAWSVDGARQAGMSGIGKSAVIVASPLQYRARTVSVVVTSQDGTLASGAVLPLLPVLPSVRIYENDPLLGIRFDRALGSSYTITGAEAPLYAALYSFPVNGGAPAVDWYLNGSPAETGPLITLRPTGKGRGGATLSLVAAIDDIARATAALSLSFGSGSSSSFFGL